MLQFWMECYNFGWNATILDEMVQFSDKMLQFWMKWYNCWWNFTILNEMLQFWMKCYFLDEMLLFWMQCYNFGWNVTTLDEMLQFWSKCYNFGTNVTILDQMLPWDMAHGIWSNINMAHWSYGPHVNLAYFDPALLRKSGRATGQAPSSLLLHPWIVPCDTRFYDTSNKIKYCISWHS